MIIGKRLKELRLENKMSQHKLGELLGVSKVSISGYETGSRTPSVEVLCEIARLFGVSTDFLLGMEIPLIAEDTKDYIGAISMDDIQLIYDLRMYPNMYNKLLEDSKRYSMFISKKIK